MTDEEFERAGRRLCELRGQDPDELIGHSPRADERGIVAAVLLSSPAWRLATHEVKNFLTIAQAIDHVMTEGQE